MLVARIIVCIIMFIALIGAMYGIYEGIKRKDDKLTYLCSLASPLIGLLLGFCIGFLCFNI